MTDSKILEKAIDAIIVLNAAFTNIRLYPPTSAMIGKSIDSAASIFQGIFEHEDSLILAESERNLIVSGQMLAEKDSLRPQVAAFIQLMLKLGIKSITFERGMEKSEILSLLEVVTKKPEDLQKEGGILKVILGKNLKKIHLDQKLYVAMDKGQQITDSSVQTEPDARPENGQRLQIKSGIDSIIKGEEKGFRDKLVMQALPPTILDLITRGKDKIADAIINRLGAALLNQDAEIRSEAALAFARAGVKLISDKRMEDLKRISPKLIAWIKFETLIPPAYKHIANHLSILSQHLILNHRLLEAMEVLNPFHMISSGKIKKSEQVQALSEGVLKGIASDEVIQSLLQQIKTYENKLGECAIEIMVLLGSFSVGGLLALLDHLPASGQPGDPKQTIQLQKRICSALGQIGSEAAIPALKAVVEKSESRHYDDEVKAAAGKALDEIQKIHSDKDVTQSPEDNVEASHHDTVEMEPEKQTPAEMEFCRQLQLVEQHVQNKDTGAAVKVLFDLIVRYAKEKDFDKAETLRDKLMDVNPMALNEIIKSGELIEEEKSGSIDQAHMNLWSTLYNTLTKEEASSLFFAMKPAKYEAGHTIFRNGDHDSRLYFINKGQIKLMVNQGGKETFIKELKPGDMLGEEAFFSLSLCTTSAITLSAVELNYLEKEILTRWDVKSYGIESKLHDYCLKLKKTGDQLGGKGPQLRTQERLAIAGKVKVQFMDASGSPVGEPIMGALSDISQGGMSFYLNIKKDKITKMFLNPRLNLNYKLATGGTEQIIDQNGTMVAAIPHYYDYSIHVKFDNLLDKNLLKDIKTSNNSADGELEMLMDA
jgi:ribosomal 50S subunit-associated protein YjgA (DUF615 family)